MRTWFKFANNSPSRRTIFRIKATAALVLVLLAFAGCDGPTAGPPKAAKAAKAAAKKKITWRGLDTGYEGATIVQPDGTEIQE